MIPALDVEPNPNSVEIMTTLDRLTPAMRALVREFGYAIVRDMINDGYRNARQLRPLLETWRERRQEQLLATDYFRRTRRGRST